MQFEVQAVKLPSPMCEKNAAAVINCQVRNNELSGQQDPLHHNFGTRQAANAAASDSELITPRKVTNPCLQSFNHQNLHRELLFNNKVGKNVLNQKSELHKALEKHKETQMKKEQLMQKEAARGVLEKAIEERAKRLELMEKSAVSESDKPEFLQVHAKVCSKALSK